jgi:hypothetical protein
MQEKMKNKMVVEHKEKNIHYANKRKGKDKDMRKPYCHAKRGVKTAWRKKKRRSEAREWEINQRRGNQLAKNGIVAWPTIGTTTMWTRSLGVWETTKLLWL